MRILNRFGLCGDGLQDDEVHQEVETPRLREMQHRLDRTKSEFDSIRTEVEAAAAQRRHHGNLRQRMGDSGPLAH
jgi:hypothetical protein